jgi:acetolactate synthase I/III small subunit
MKHTISALVENKPGVLSRVSGLFTRRGFNIESLAVSPTEDADRSRMTITVDTTKTPVEQITKQLDKLINVIKVRELDPQNIVSRELGLYKVTVKAGARSEIIEICEIFHAKIVDVTPDTLTIELTGESEALVRFEDLLRPLGLMELVKTGVVALGRGSNPT